MADSSAMATVAASARIKAMSARRRARVVARLEAWCERESYSCFMHEEGGGMDMVRGGIVKYEMGLWLV